jgi:membrane-bound lytic murein transglycosylase D
MAFRQYPEPLVLLAVAAFVASLVGCTAGLAPSVSQSHPASETLEQRRAPEEPAASTENRRETAPPPEAPPPQVDPPPPSPLELAMERADTYYERGLQAMGNGDSDQAELEFDAALEALVDSGLAVSQPRLLGLHRPWPTSFHGWLSPPAHHPQEARADTAPPDPDEPTQKAPALLDSDDDDVGTAAPGEVTEVPEPDIQKYEFPIVFNDQVKTFLQYFQTRKWGVINLGFERASRYLPMMRRVFREKGLPEELLNLAFIESAVNPWATSRAKAAGIWQFMAPTARLYGMQVSWWIDERRDPEKATRGAADYLANLYQMFGVWDLALAAYNAGEGKVQRTIDRQRTRDYWKLRLPKETQLFVPAFMAMTIISKEPERYGFSPPPDAPPLTETVTLDHPADFRTLARAGGISVEELRQLNPALIRGTTPPDASRQSLRVPAGRSDVLLEELTKIPPHERVAWIAHRVRAGETVGSIAKRYRVSQQAVLEMNGLKKQQGLKPGGSLLVPWSAAAGPVDERERKHARRVNASPTRHVVKKGETVAQIARAYGVATDELQRANGLSRNASLRAGQTLNVPGSATQQDASSARKALADSVARPFSVPVGERRYTVKRGDTLTEIARTHKVSVEDLRRWNELPRDAPIQPGQMLRIREPAS